MKAVRLAVATVAAGSAVLMSATGATAAPKGDPTQVRTANPAGACAAIPTTVQMLGGTADDFDFSTCVRMLAGTVPNVDFGDPAEQCATLEEGMMTPGGFFQVTYPYTFHAEPGDPFPDLRAHNRQQCARALYAFHTIESYLPPPPPPPPGQP